MYEREKQYDSLRTWSNSWVYSSTSITDEFSVPRCDEHFDHEFAYYMDVAYLSWTKRMDRRKIAECRLPHSMQTYASGRHMLRLKWPSSINPHKMAWGCANLGSCWYSCLSWYRIRQDALSSPMPPESLDTCDASPFHIAPMKLHDTCNCHRRQLIEVNTLSA